MASGQLAPDMRRKIIETGVENHVIRMVNAASIQHNDLHQALALSVMSRIFGNAASMTLGTEIGKSFGLRRHFRCRQFRLLRVHASVKC